MASSVISTAWKVGLQAGKQTTTDNHLLCFCATTEAYMRLAGHACELRTLKLNERSQREANVICNGPQQ